MKQMKLFTVCIFCLVMWGLCSAVVEAQSSTEELTALRIATQDLPPYGWEDVQQLKHGIIYELNQELGIRSGLPFTNKILPMNRMLMMLKRGDIDLISCQTHQAALDAGDKLAVQFKVDVIAGTKKGSGIRKIEDFKGKSLVYHHAASYRQLEGLPRKIHRVKSYKQSMQVLYFRPKVDGAVITEPAYYYWIQELGFTPDDFGDIVMIEPDKKQWIFVRKGLPQKTRESLKRVVEEIYQESLYEQLLRKYGKK